MRKNKIKEISDCRYAYEVTELLAKKIKNLDKYRDCKIETFPPVGIGATCSLFATTPDDNVYYITVGYRRDGFTYILKSNETNDIVINLPTDIDEVIKLIFR